MTSKFTITTEQRDELRREWVKALRSGEFKQAHGKLEIEGEGQCCLGVACRVFDSKYPGVLEIRRQACSATTLFNGITLELPDLVSKALGMCGANGVMRAQKSLVYMNDNGETFDRIADVIECNIGDNRNKLFVDETT